MSDTEEQIEMEEPNQKMVLSKRPSFVNPKTYAAFDAKPKAPKASKKSKNKHKIKFERGYMYIGHIPHGFYEEQCKSYFSQFGRVCRIKLARSKATGKHKGYGFIEFENEEVAKIAADTMNNYLMFNKLLKCQLISKEKLHKLTFKNAKKNFFLKLDSTFRKRFNADKSDDKLKRIEIRNSIKLKKTQEKLKEAGFNLDLSKLNKFESPTDIQEEVKPKKEVAKPKASPVEAKKASAAAEKAPEVEKPKGKPTKKQPEPAKTTVLKKQPGPIKAAAAAPAVAKKQPEPVKAAATNKKSKSKK